MNFKRISYKSIFIAMNIIFGFCTYILIDHLQEDHGAGHHIIYFIFIPIICFLWWMKIDLDKQALAKDINQMWQREFDAKFSTKENELLSVQNSNNSSTK